MEKEKALAIVAENGRTIRELGSFSAKELPIIGLTSEHRPCFAAEVDYQVDLLLYADKLKALQPGEVFAIGRRSDCDVRPGYADHAKWCAAKGIGNEELLYMKFYRTISRIHAFVERDGDTYKVYDTSLAGTVIVHRPQPAAEPKKSWLKRFLHLD